MTMMSESVASKLLPQVEPLLQKKELPPDVKQLLKKMTETLREYESGSCPSGEFCLRIQRGDFDENLETVQAYVNKRLRNPARRAKKVDPDDKDD